MLKIFNNLKPFFKDNYQRIHVREYARITGISPPSASKLLAAYKKEGLLKKEEEKNYIYYTADKESKIFIELSRIYWYTKIRDSRLLEHLEKELINPLVILFGSFSKAEVMQDSDIDIAIFTKSKKQINLEPFEKKLKRKIQAFQFKEEPKSKELLNNIHNGFILTGSW